MTLSVHGLQQRSDLLQALRGFFLSRRYVEVDTPVRLPVVLPESQLLPFSTEGWFLQTSPEMCMKRLLSAGSSRIFQICHCFRKEESGRFHETEFTLLEWYHCGWDYHDLMQECAELVPYLVSAIMMSEEVEENVPIIHRHGQVISLGGPWQKMTVEEAFQRYTEMSAREALQANLFDELLVTRIEPHLGWETPLFLYDYPVECGSLARVKEGQPEVVERFELYVAGLELANGFSELIDAVEQRRRFAHDLAELEKKGVHLQMPEVFLADLATLEKTAGIALGVDRLLMVLTGADSITDVVPFAAGEL